MTCRLWVDQGHIACESWADEVSGSCVSWRDEGQNQCTNWSDEGSNQCSQWKDEGQNQCSQWADQGHNECCDWWPCSWACDAFYWVADWVCQGWYWVANWVCQAWYWVAKWVCIAWYWVANWVCQVFAWVVTAVCLVWSWVAKLVCVIWDQGKCLLVSIFGSRPRSRSPIQHVFVLMLENRAFDHMLGFSGITGTDALTGAQRAVDGAMGSTAFNYVDPAAMTGKTVASTEADFKFNKPPDVDPGHEFPNTLIALCGPGASYPNGGAYPPINNSGFIVNYATTPTQDNTGDPAPVDPTKIMKCFSPKRVPVLNALANEFAVCDRWFSSMPGPTWPNRFFMHAASSGGLDDSPSGLQSFGNVAFDGYRFENGTIFDRLDDACIEWRVFAGDSFPVTLALSGMTINELEGRIHDFDDFSDAVNDPDFSTAYTFIEPNYGNDLPPSSEDFTCGNSQHPLDDITRGERLIKTVYETIRNSPHWDTSLLLVTYDEHGGFFDHVAPPGAVAPGDPISDDDNDHHDFTFEQLGVRVPAVVISPLIPRGMIDGTVYDHTSLLATVEQFFGLKPLTKRDAAAKTFSHLLSLASPRSNAPTQLPEPAVSGFHCGDDPRFAAAASSGGNAADDGRDWQKNWQPVGSSLRGFEELALLKALTIARGRDRRQIRKEYLAAQTRGGARYFIRKVAIMAQQLRLPPPGSRKASPPRRWLFGIAPQRLWRADPLHEYRATPAPSGSVPPPTVPP
jgi:phospholipase C